MQTNWLLFISLACLNCAVFGCSLTKFQPLTVTEINLVEAASEPILPTFESINRNIFNKSCTKCHNETSSGKRVLLDKDSLLNSPLELVLPNNPDESGLVIAIERTDKKRMPPPKEGIKALGAEAQSAVRKWIENGAVD